MMKKANKNNKDIDFGGSKDKEEKIGGGEI